MANYSTLKAAVADVVKTNGTQAITGANLQSVLLSIINSIGGGGYIFKGVATPSTNAGTPDENVFYLGGAGTYANFGTSVTVPVGSVCVFKYNGSWVKEQIAVNGDIDIEEIVEDIEAISAEIYGGNTYIDYGLTLTSGKYINTGNPVGENPSNFSDYPVSCTSIAVSAGDKFKIYGHGGSYAIRLWAFADANNNNLLHSGNEVDASNGIEFEAPAGAVRLVINFRNYNASTDKLQKYGSVEGLKSGVSELTARLDGVDETFEYLDDTINPIVSNPLKGVTFPDTTPTAVRNAITKIWIASEDPDNIQKVLNNAPKLYLFDINNTTGSYRPFFGFSPTKENPQQAFSYYDTSQSTPRAVKEIVRAIIREPFYTNWGISYLRVYIYVEIDWSLITGNIDNLAIELDIATINRAEIQKSNLSDVGNSIEQNSLFGKTVVCFGDSITEGRDSGGNRYSDYLGLLSGANVINVGIGGACLRQRITPSLTPEYNSKAYAALDIVNMVAASAEQDFSLQIAAANYLKDNTSDDNTAIVARLQAIDWTKVDIVTIFGGTNDWGSSAENIGTSGEVNKSHTLGAVNYIIQNLLTAYPHVKLFWFTPIVRWIDYANGTGVVEKWGDNYDNNNAGYTLKQLSALIKTEVELSHIPVCDWYNNLGWNMWNFSNYFAINDGTHPKKPAGYRALAERMFSFLNSHRNY